MKIINEDSKIYVDDSGREYEVLPDGTVQEVDTYGKESTSTIEPAIPEEVMTIKVDTNSKYKDYPSSIGKAEFTIEPSNYDEEYTVSTKYLSNPYFRSVEELEDLRDTIQKVIDYIK